LNSFDHDLTEDQIINQIHHLRSEISSQKSKSAIKDKMIEILKKRLTERENSTLLTNTNSDNGIYSKDYIDKNRLTLSMSIPRWVPDKIVKNCLICTKNFGFFKRKHHCRLCGNIFCTECCSNYTFFSPYYEGLVRSCEDCYKKQKEVEITQQIQTN